MIQGINMLQVEMEFSALPEGYRRAFTKRLQERAVGIDAKPSGLNKEEQEGYNDADLAFLAKNSVNASVKSKSAKYRKAYHKALYDAATGSPDTAASDNAEIEQARQNAKRKINDPEFIPDLMNQKVLEQLANVELAAPKAEPEELVFNESGEVTGEAAAKAIATSKAAPVPLYTPVGMDEEYEKEQDEARLQELKSQLEKCKEACTKLDQEYKEYIEINEKKKLEGITLPLEAKLIDLLVERILDPDESWKTKIDTLILIPHSLKGDFLRGGDYFEALFQLAIVIGILSQFRGKFIKMYDIDQYKRLIEKENYLYSKPVKNSGGSEQGVSDITFEVSTNQEFTFSKPGYVCGEKPLPKESALPFYFISVKGYKKEKSLKDAYDIPLLDKQITLFPEKTNKKVVVCVRNKEQFLVRMSRTKIDFLKGYPVIGYDEVIEAFTEFRVNFFNRLMGEKTKDSIKAAVQELFPPSNTQKPMLSLYFHQELISKSTIQRIKEEEPKYKRRATPHFLCIGVLPRGGKSYIAGGIMNEHMKFINKREGYNVLFLTSAVTETRKQFREDLIQKFSDFSNFSFVDVVVPPTIEELKVSEERGKNNFYFISRQLSSLKEESTEGAGEQSIAEANILLSLQRKLGALPKFDICFFDEAHIGITSQTVRKNFQKVFEMFPGIPVVLMTATYKKPATILESPKDIFVWDLQDIKEMKTLPALGLDGFLEKKVDIYERYPKLAEGLLLARVTNGETLDQIAKPYKQFPNPNFINLTFTPEQIRGLLETSAGYSYEKAFRYNKDPTLLQDSSKWTQWQTLIKNTEDALRLRQFLTPDASPEDTILLNQDRKYRALNQIYRIAQANASRPMPGRPFSMLMFLPILDHQSIGELCRIWASFLHQSPYWRDNFIFMTLSPVKYRRTEMKIEEQITRGIVMRDDHPGRDLKDLIEEVEREALNKGKGLVLLSGDVAKMGISLPCVDIVFLMSSDSDADDIIQKMYRALTDNPPTKKDGFIVDLDLKRIVSAIFEYDLSKDSMRLNLTATPTVEERLIKIGNLCNWGYDSFIQDNTTKNFNDIMEEIKSRVLNGIQQRVFLERDESKVKKEQKEFIDSDPELKSHLLDALLNTKFEKVKKPKREELLRRGLLIPDEESEANSNEEKSSAKSNASTLNFNRSSSESEKEIIIDPKFLNQFYEKVYNITKTFVNALVIKSAEPWAKSMNISALLQKYKEDKATAGDIPSCECSFNQNCKKEHNNLYEAVYCEVKSYALKQKEEQENYEYNVELHNKIMRGIEAYFENAPNIIKWNIDIEKLLNELKQMKGGAIKKKRFAVTRKDGYDHRKKIQQSTRRHR